MAAKEQVLYTIKLYLFLHYQIPEYALNNYPHKYGFLLFFAFDKPYKAKNGSKRNQQQNKFQYMDKFQKVIAY